jgi:hypothetical protein
MELWQMDIMGRVKLDRGEELKIITGLDDHSRFCVSAMLVPPTDSVPKLAEDALLQRQPGG